MQRVDHTSGCKQLDYEKKEKRLNKREESEMNSACCDGSHLIVGKQLRVNNWTLGVTPKPLEQYILYVSEVEDLYPAPC